MSAFRKGDVVTVEAVVASDVIELGGRQQIQVKIEPYHEIFVSASALTMKRPDIRVGDTIEWSASEKTWTGTVLALAHDHAWVGFGDGEYSTVWLGNARRVDPEEKHDPDFDEIEEAESEADAEERRRLETAEMDKHFERHPHG